MTYQDKTKKQAHPNPFSMEKIHRFYRENGIRVEVATGKNLYVVRKQNKPWARISYRPIKEEWILDSWHKSSMIIPFWQHKAPSYNLLSCWCREEDQLKTLEEALHMSLDFSYD